MEDNPNTELQGKDKCQKIFKSKQFIRSNAGKYNCYVDMPFQTIMSKTFVKSHNGKVNIFERLNKTVNRQNHIRSKTQASSTNLMRVSKSFKQINDKTSAKKLIAQKSQILQEEKLIKRYKIFRKNKSKSLKLFLNTKERQRKQYLIQRVGGIQQNQERLKMNKTQSTHINQNLSQTFNQRIVLNRLKITQSKDQSKFIRMRTQADCQNESSFSNYQPSISVMQTITTKKSSIKTKSNQTPKSKAEAILQMKKNQIFIPVMSQNKVISQKQPNGSASNSNRKTQKQTALNSIYSNQITYQLLRAKQKDQNLQRQIRRIKNYFDTKARFNAGPNSSQIECQIDSKQKSDVLENIQSVQESKNMPITSLKGQKGLVKLGQIGKILRQRIIQENSHPNKTQIANPLNPQQKQPFTKEQTKKQKKNSALQVYPSQKNTIQIHDNIFRKQIIVVDQPSQEVESEHKALKEQRGEQRELSHCNNSQNVDEKVVKNQQSKSQLRKIQYQQTNRQENDDQCTIF